MKDDIYSLYSSKLDLQALGVDCNREVYQLLSLPPYELPLTNYCIYSGTDPDSAASAIGSVAEPRKFELLGNADNFLMEISRAKLSRSQIGITYNSEPVRLLTLDRIKHYSLTIQLAGSATFKVEEQEILVEAPSAFFLSAGCNLDVVRSKDHLAIVMHLGIPGFETFVGDQIDLMATPESPFFIKFDITSPQFMTFGCLLSALFKLLNEPVDHHSQQDLVISRLEEALWYKFFTAAPEVMRAHREAQHTKIRSAPVKRVVDYVMEHADREITMPELVEVSGASLRSLHAGFSDAYDIGPMAFVKKIKLTRCREQLIESNPSEISVGDIAARWGFFHLSNFARYYRLEFSELPSETLKRVE